MTTGSTGSAPTDLARFERACEWFIELREKAQSPEIVAEWLEWCRADPLNREAFERARSVWQATADVRVVDLALPAFASAASLSAAAAPTSKSRPAPNRRWPLFALGAALAASVAVAALYLSPVALLHFGTQPSVATTFATEPGENRTVQLPDGSTLALGGGSRIRTEFDGDARRLTLERGEAYFQVKHDRARPFIVAAGRFRVTAVGTSFNVRTASERIVVAVADGVVAIEPPATSSPLLDDPDIEPQQQPSSVLRGTLHARAGQEVVLDSAEQQLQVARIEPQSVASWQTGRLEFAREPLRAVLASVNRYSTRPVTLDNPALGDFRFTGTVFADRVDDWLRGLSEVFPVSVREEAAGVIIELRDQSVSADRTVQ